MIACDPCMLARHGVAQTHGMRRDLATVKAIAGDSSFFNHTIRGAGSVHAGRSCRRGYDSGQPFLINHTIFSLQSFHVAYLLETAPVSAHRIRIGSGSIRMLARSYGWAMGA